MYPFKKKRCYKRSRSPPICLYVCSSTISGWHAHLRMVYTTWHSLDITYYRNYSSCACSPKCPSTLNFLTAFHVVCILDIPCRLRLSRGLVSGLSFYLLYHRFILCARNSYGPFASSALAGQSLCRKSSSTPSAAGFLDAHDAAAGNIAGMAFPLFTQQMYARLTYKWANTLFGLIAALMIPIPFVSLVFSSLRSIAEEGTNHLYIFIFNYSSILDSLFQGTRDTREEQVCISGNGEGDLIMVFSRDGDFGLDLGGSRELSHTRVYLIRKSRH